MMSRKFLSQRTVMPYSADAAEAERAPLGERADDVADVADGRGTRRLAPRSCGASGSTFRPSMPTTPKPSLSRWCASV